MGWKPDDFNREWKRIQDIVNNEPAIVRSFDHADEGVLGRDANAGGQHLYVALRLCSDGSGDYHGVQLNKVRLGKRYAIHAIAEFRDAAGNRIGQRLGFSDCVASDAFGWGNRVNYQRYQLEGDPSKVAYVAWAFRGDFGCRDVAPGFDWSIPINWRTPFPPGR